MTNFIANKGKEEEVGTIMNSMYDAIKKEMLTAHYEMINKIRSDFQKVEVELTKQNIQYVNTIRNNFFGLRLTNSSFYIGAKPDVLNHRIILNIDGSEEYLDFMGGLVNRVLEHIISKEIPEIEW
jgi:hypothetical protein